MKKQISALLLAAALSVSFAAGCGGKQPEETAGAAVVHADGEVLANEAEVYRVFVTDTEGKPVADASVQFCSDVTCTLQKTDADGMASFEADEGAYTAHVLKVPEGYEKNTREYEFSEEYSDLYIQLTSGK